VVDQTDGRDWNPPFASTLAAVALPAAISTLDPITRAAAFIFFELFIRVSELQIFLV
jgi:hypothetical protein